MKFNRLTKRENQIMEVFWNSEKPLSSYEISNEAPELSKSTIQTSLRNLCSAGFIQVAGVSLNKKALTREYAPAISQAEYLLDQLGDEASLQFALHYIEDKANPEDLDKLQEAINAKR